MAGRTGSHAFLERTASVQLLCHRNLSVVALRLAKSSRLRRVERRHITQVSFRFAIELASHQYGFAAAVLNHLQLSKQVFLVLAANIGVVGRKAPAVTAMARLTRGDQLGTRLGITRHRICSTCPLHRQAGGKNDRCSFDQGKCSIGLI